MKLSLTLAEDGAGGRRCGSCTLCCKLLPVKALGKPGGSRCQHQRFGKGCAIYGRAPLECRTWSCRWLVDPEPGRLPRPDRCGYVFDIMPDTIGARDDATGVVHEIGVVQVWCDPNRRGAWRDPALLDYLDGQARQHGMAAIVRWTESHGQVLIPPSMNTTGGWVEKESRCDPSFQSLIKRNAAGMDQVLKAVWSGPDAVPGV